MGVVVLCGCGVCCDHVGVVAILLPLHTESCCVLCCCFVPYGLLAVEDRAEGEREAFHTDLRDWR